MLFGIGIKNPDALPVISIELDEFMVVRSILISIVEALILEDNMEAYMPVSNIHVAVV